MNNQIKAELQAFMGSDRDIANAAWTSSTTLQGKQKRTQEDVERVVKMLIEQKHATPIESVVFRFWIKMPIQTDRQHVVHRIATHSGMSGRFRTMPSEYLEVPKDIENILCQMYSNQDTHKEVKRIINEYNNFCEDVNSWYRDFLEEAKEAENNQDISNKEYKRLREFFRGVLPQNNMTERVTIFNLRSFANYQKLRNSEHAQPEIRQVAQLMLDAVKKANVCPIAIKALEDNNWEI